MHYPAPRRPPASSSQRVAVNGHSSEAAVPSLERDALRSSGHPLDPATRATMEGQFGYDFSSVRVHTDSPADEAARALHARAFTIGNDVAFARGAYSPMAPKGLRLMAHELAHVVQQGGRAPVGHVADHTGELAADQAAQVVAAGGRAHLSPLAVTGPQLSPDKPPGPAPSAALTPDEMWTQLVQSRRGFESSSSGAGDTYRSSPAKVPPGSLSVDEAGNPTAKGAPLGKGYETFAGVQLVDADGNRVAVAADGFGGGGADDHAEARCVRTLEKHGPTSLVGGKLVVVSDQTICPTCRQRLIKYAKSRGLTVIEPHEPARAKMVGAGQASPKTTSRSSTQAGRPALSVVPREPIRISPPPTAAPRSVPAAPRVKPSGTTAGGPKASVKAPSKTSIKAPGGGADRTVRRVGGGGPGGGFGAAAAAIVSAVLGMVAQRYLQGEMNEKNAKEFEKKLQAQQSDIVRMVTAQDATIQSLQRQGKPAFANVTIYVRYQTDVSGQLGGLTALMDVKVRKVEVSSTKIPYVTESQVKQGFFKYAVKDSLGISESLLSFSLSYPELEPVSLPDPAALPPPNCFIATACYGSPDAAEVQLLRRFRDEWLLNYRMGRAFIHFYYAASPPVAHFLRTHEPARKAVRVGIVAPVARLVRSQSSRWRSQSGSSYLPAPLQDTKSAMSRASAIVRSPS